MALADFFWACPRCGADRGLDRDGRCVRCGTRFERGDGATIRAITRNGTVEVRSPAEWLDRLPEPADLLGDLSRKTPVRTARVGIRPVVGDRRVYGERGYLNRVEIFGDETEGILELYPDRLRVRWDGPPAGGAGTVDEGAFATQNPGEHEDSSAEDWPFERLTAVQASSGALQFKRRGRPLVSFRFLDDAIYLWERLVRAALRDFYGRTGRGTIREFQPRIVTR